MKRLRLQAGSNLIEFALVLPVLLLLVFGIIDFGFAIYDKSVITNASREGARNGIVFDNTRLTKTDIQNVVSNYAATRMLTFASANLIIDVVPADTSGVVSGDTLTVTVTYPYHYLVINKLVPSLTSLTLKSTSVMRYE